MPDFMEFITLNEYVHTGGEKLLIGKVNGMTLMVVKNRSRWGPDWLGYVTNSFIDLDGEYRRVILPRPESSEPPPGFPDDAPTHQSKKGSHARSP